MDFLFQVKFQVTASTVHECKYKHSSTIKTSHIIFYTFQRSLIATPFVYTPSSIPPVDVCTRKFFSFQPFALPTRSRDFFSSTIQKLFCFDLSVCKRASMIKHNSWIVNNNFAKQSQYHMLVVHHFLKNIIISPYDNHKIIEIN